MLGRFVSELFRGNGIHHSATCTSRQPYLGPVSSTQSLIDAYESATGEIIYTCTECGRLAVWRDRVLQPDPVWELEHAEVRSHGEAERAAAADALARHGRRRAPGDGAPAAGRKRGGRRPGTGLRFPTAESLLSAYRASATRRGRPPTQAELAEDEGTGVSTIKDTLRRLQMDWPPE